MNLMNTEIGLVLNRASYMLTMRSIWFSVFRDTQFKKLILDWIRYDQLFKHGVDEDGDIIGTYSEWTEMMNPEKVAGTPYTLFDTGDFYESMIVVVNTNASILIDGDPIKTDENGEKTDLFQKFGDGIVGLTEENRRKLAQECIERFNKHAIQILRNNG
jgi:hypothetical protein